MILKVFVYRNKKMGCYTNPIFIQENEENTEVNMTRAIIAAGKEESKKYKSLALYKLGTFDDVKGKFELLDEPELLVDCDDIIAKVEASL